MAVLQSLPNCLPKPGSEDADGVGNHIVQITAAAPLRFPALTLYLLDSHGVMAGFLGKLLSKSRNRFDHIKWSQIKWFLETLERQHREHEQMENDNAPCLSLAVFPVPLPESRNCDSNIRTGSCREPTEGPFYNSRFYEALAEKGIAAILARYDHLNNHVAQLLQQGGQVGRPYLCLGGSAGFGAYGEYSGKRAHRQACHRPDSLGHDPRASFARRR